MTIDTMLAAGFNITGVDVSAVLLNMAKARHPNVEFFHDDIVEGVTTSRILCSLMPH
jgi:trans-aconitate methyltransferase